MMKKILFTVYSMDYGGIERALVTILKKLDYRKYDVTILLEKKAGVFLKEVPECVAVKEYKISDCKVKILRKIWNRLKLVCYVLRNYHKYAFAASFATSSIPMGLVSRYSSKNSAIWVHNDYKYFYKENETEIRKFFKRLQIERFNKIVFVSNESKEHFLEYYKALKDKCNVCNNLIDAENIIKLSTEEQVEKDSKVLINVSRHDEHQKKISKLINVAKKLVDQNYDFELWLIGEGKDQQLYQEQVNALKLEKYVKLLGGKENPYPYYKTADCFVLSSDYEGFPVVYLESMVLGLPIITTIPVTDSSVQMNDFAILCEKTEESLYQAIEDFLKNGFPKKKEFNAEQFNKVMLEKLEELINGSK